MSTGRPRAFCHEHGVLQEKLIGIPPAQDFAFVVAATSARQAASQNGFACYREGGSPTPTSRSLARQQHRERLRARHDAPSPFPIARSVPVHARSARRLRDTRAHRPRLAPLLASARRDTRHLLSAQGSLTRPACVPTCTSAAVWRKSTPSGRDRDRLLHARGRQSNEPSMSGVRGGLAKPQRRPPQARPRCVQEARTRLRQFGLGAVAALSRLRRAAELERHVLPADLRRRVERTLPRRRI